MAAAKIKKPSVEDGLASSSRASLRQWLIQPKVRSMVRCTTLPSASVCLIRPARGRWWDAEDDLDVSIIDLDASNNEAKDIALGRPVQHVEALEHMAGSVPVRSCPSSVPEGGVSAL